MADPSVTDVPIITPAPRAGSLPAIQQHLQTVSGLGGIAQRLSRQHRTILLALRDLSVSATPLAELNLTASVGYVAAEVQSLADKLDEMIARQTSIEAKLDALIATANTALVSPQDAAFQEQ